ncbi:sentrin-specific protease 1-like protein [Leptotrombidium deliense]|uniref:Sentrin-specific protease 1-like protein n=1 Tax=Leptotrombidium deliense TaxID=299467 RepID=A0A443SV70_9ACAR|nr:sentrin-specific protease 1-like protein [Leptotrombidium deliense]
MQAHTKPNQLSRKRKREECEPEPAMNWFRSLKEKLFGKQDDRKFKVPRFDDFERRNREATNDRSALNMTSTPKPKKKTPYSWFQLKEKRKLSQLIQEHLMDDNPVTEQKQNATQTDDAKPETVVDLAEEAIERRVIDNSAEKERLKAKIHKNEEVKETPDNDIIPQQLPESVTKLKEMFVTKSRYFETDWLKELQQEIKDNREQEQKQSQEDHKYLAKLEDERLTRKEKIDSVFKKRINDNELPYSLYTLYISKPPEEEEEEEVTISDEMNELIECSLNDGSGDDMIVNNLKRSDLHTLLGLNWLNDEIINEYFTLIEKTFDGVKCLNTFFYKRLKSNGFQGVKRWTKKFDLFSYSLVLIPLHLQVHWTLISISMDDKSIHYFDSMSTDESVSGQKYLETIRSYLQDEYKDKKGGTLDVSEWKLVEEKKIPLQLNGSDCGMFCCKYAYYLSKGKPFSFHQSMMPYFRRRMIYELVTQELL